MKTLQLSLKKVWFTKIENLEKQEEYREIMPYWCARFLLFDGQVKSKRWWDGCFESVDTFGGNIVPHIIRYTKLGFFKYKQFDTIKFTLGYPKSTDLSRILNIENKGLSIGKGRPEWGAEPDKYYFVFKLGEKIV